MSARASSGRDPEQLTLDDVRAGEVRIGDVSIHPDVLEHQAAVAEQHANPQLAANFRRASELVEVPDEEVLAIYEALRPHRSTYAQLGEVADGLERRGAVLNAALVREAAEAYARRGLLAR